MSIPISDDLSYVQEIYSIGFSFSEVDLIYITEKTVKQNIINLKGSKGENGYHCRSNGGIVSEEKFVQSII